MGVNFEKKIKLCFFTNNCYIMSPKKITCWLDGWVEGRKEGRKLGKAGLRTAYSNQ